MQRLAAATKASTASNTEMPADQFCSRLADHLVIQWAWGKYSPQEIQLLAHLATRDMEALGLSEIPTSLTSLAALGSHGRHANNCHRDLIHYMKDKTFLPDPLQVHMPFVATMLLQAVMLPHLVFHTLFTKYPTYWANCFLPGGVKSLVKFWKHMMPHPSMQDFQGHRQQWQRWTIPLNLHGDAVPTIGCGKVWSKMLQGYSWTGLLSKGSTKSRSFFIWGATGLHIYNTSRFVSHTIISFKI